MRDGTKKDKNNMSIRLNAPKSLNAIILCLSCKRSKRLPKQKEQFRIQKTSSTGIIAVKNVNNIKEERERTMRINKSQYSIQT